MLWSFFLLNEGFQSLSLTYVQCLSFTFNQHYFFSGITLQLVTELHCFANRIYPLTIKCDKNEFLYASKNHNLYILRFLTKIWPHAFRIRIESRWGAGFSTPIKTHPWGTPSLLYNGYWVTFPGQKRPERGVDHPPPSSNKVKERLQLHLYSPSGPLWPVLGWTLPLPLLFKFTAFRGKYCLITIKDEGAGDDEEGLAKVVHKVQVVVALNYTTFEAFTCPSVVYNEHSQ